ncbi:alpha-amylase family glycosyl hydrolase [Arenibaculum sp.]|uniref:alpha-amylase family glycosyl hydrolase n=1 Tax=Arenibaculum sp. TaxID=2865862 RepID=UPI002E0D7673|nr:alpha-amylase family glycosyl hydrolase [Arenibaculum sp.]
MIRKLGRASWCLLALVLADAPALAAGPALVLAPALVLDGAGGDAWSFTKPVRGRVEPGACDEVAVRSPAGEVPAWLDGAAFEAAVPLRPGANPVRAVCRRDGAEVALSAPLDWHLRLEDGPKAWIRTRVDGGTVRLDAGRTERARGTPAPVLRYEWRARPGNPAPLALPAAGERVEIPVPPADGEYYVTLRATDALGRADESTAVFRVEGGAPVAVDLAREHPAWVDDAVLYGVVPFLFGPDGLRAVAARLDAIAALGATAIWLSPITDSPPDDFGYAVVDPFRVRPAFGTPDDLRALVDAAHARGLRVLMDFVPNHVSDRHPYYRDTARRGAASPYHGWFERDAEGRATHYFDWENLKNLDFDNPEVGNYVVAGFAHWVREFGIDGFRVDASWGVQERAPEFWPHWRAELKRIDPDLFLLAEASARDPYHVANGFDAAYDWTGRLGEWAWRDAFGEGGADADPGLLRAALVNGGAGFPDDTLVLRFLNNNDTGARFVTRHGPARTRVAAVLLFTAPGLPLVYNGDEVGAAFEPYDEGPPIAWRDDHGLTPHLTRLAALRRDVPALRSREIEPVRTTRDDVVLAYRRPGATPAGDVLVLLNFGGEAVDVGLDPAGPAVTGTGRFDDLLNGGTAVLDPRAPALRLPAYGSMVLRARL